MRGSVYRQCWCKIPGTKKRYTKKNPCPKLKGPKHGKWYARYDSASEDRRQPVLGPFGKKADAEEELAQAIAREGGGGAARDRQLRAGTYLDTYLAGKRKLKPSSRAADAEAYALYWKPALGMMRLVDLRDSHVSAVITAMEQVCRPLPKGEEVSEMLRRMLAARADDDRRVLADGETRHKKSTRPLSPARIERMFAPFRAAMNAAVKTKKLDFSPCTGVELPGNGYEKPPAWTSAREAAYRGEGTRRASAGRPGTAGSPPPGARRCGRRGTCARPRRWYGGLITRVPSSTTSRERRNASWPCTPSPRSAACGRTRSWE